MQSYIFDIAGWKVTVCFSESDGTSGMDMLPSFQNFCVADTNSEPLLEMTVDQQLPTLPEKECEYNSVEQTLNGDIVVNRFHDGSYQFVIKNIKGDVCAVMHGNHDFSVDRCRVYGNEKMRQFGLNNAMMLAYAFAGARRHTILIHASVVRHDEKGYAFVARSGTGKSTQTQNWLKTIPGCDLMNDDNPAVRVVDGAVWIYGTPWSGKTPCYRQVKAKLAAVTKIDRHTANYVEKVAKLVGFNHLLSSCSVLRCDKEKHLGICDTVSAVCSQVDNYILHCTADPESAVVCHNAISN